MYITRLIFAIASLVAIHQASYAGNSCDTDFLDLVMPHVKEWSNIYKHHYSFRTRNSEEHLGVNFEDYSQKTGEYTVSVYNEVTDSDGTRESNVFRVRINTRKKFIGMIDINSETGRMKYLLDVDKILYRNFVKKCL